MGLNAGSEFEASWQFFGQNGMGVVAEHKMHLVLLHVEIIEQALRVKSPAGAGHGHKNSHGWEEARFKGLSSKGENWRSSKAEPLLHFVSHFVTIPGRKTKRQKWETK